MARKGKRSGKGDESDGGFNVILGTRMSHDSEPEKESKREVAEAEKKPVPEEPAPVAQESSSAEDLLKKKQQIKKMLASLNDARSRSNMPTYSFHRMKKMYVAELARINALLSAKVMPAQVKEGEPGRPKGRGAGKTGKKPEGNAARDSESVMMEDLVRRVERVESAHGLLPSFKSQLESLKSKMDEYEQVVARLRSDEEELSKELPRIKRSLSALNGRVSQERPGKKAAAREPPAADLSAMERISRKVDALAGKLTGTLEALKSRIDQVSVVDELETKAYVRDLKKDISKVRSELADFLKKEDLTKLVLHPVVEGGAEQAQAPRSAKGRPGKKEMVTIDALGGMLGKDIAMECSLSLLKSVTQRGMRMYWYRIEDATGESILTSGSEIRAKKARLEGSVKRTKTGSVYVEFRRLGR
ncbi:MAG: hypothetical protein JXC85_06425 [Candidatus Aenigmarchaeota archaeon]|nr:hypothetical protein [Candidatus Aenigmarchaeota archaeon]